jgi:isopentenyl diphosphate isomerase/L-lactate dehydrogenase-like FMN-dependent dehydrogenase
LPEIVDAVGDRLEVYLDGGIRLGTDVLKALALGARAVFIGRAYHWGLAAEGEVGVSRVLEILRYELESAMGLCGVSDIRRVDRSLVAASVPSTIHPRRPEAAES